MRRVSVNAVGVVAALCLLPDMASGQGLGSLTFKPANKKVMQGEAFTVFWDPSNTVPGFFFPLTVTVGPDPSALQLVPSVVAVENSATSVVITIPSDMPTGSLTFKVTGSLPKLPTFDITIQQAALPTPAPSSASETASNPTTAISLSTTFMMISTSVSPISTSLTSGDGAISDSTRSPQSTSSRPDSTSSSGTQMTGSTSPHGAQPHTAGPILQSSPGLDIPTGSISSTFASITATDSMQFTSTSVPSRDTDNQRHSHGLSAGKISAIVICLLLLLIILVLLFRWRKKRARNTTSLGIDYNTFGQLMVEKSVPLGDHHIDDQVKLPASTRAQSPGIFFDVNNHQNRVSPVALEPDTFSNSSSGSVPPNYPADAAVITVEKDKSYGNQNLEELQEHRQKMRDLIDVLKERRRSHGVTGVTFVMEGH